MGMTNVDGCTLSATNTDKLQRSFGTLVSGQNVWQFLGFVTNNSGVSNPVIRFYRVAGEVSAGTSSRVIFDTFRFTYYQPCADIPTVSVDGPLATNVATIRITGVSPNATAIKLYQDAGTGMTNIGTIITSIPPAAISVPVSGVLVRGAQVAATQTITNQEACLPTSGTMVGGGANQSIRIAFSMRYDPTMTGPPGAAGTTAGNVYFLGSTSPNLSGPAPSGGAVLAPSPCWQTVTFTRGDPNNPTDPSVLWAGTGPAVLEGDYGALDGLAIACEGDPGPVDIYLDDLENGTNGVVQSWEAAADTQAAYGFSQPSFSGTTGGNILANPNSSVATISNAYSGTKSARVQFQFRDGTTNRWVRLVTASASPVQNPQLDLRQPISIKVLVLPAGQSAHAFAGTIGPITNAAAYTGGDVTLGLRVTGGPFTYQWSYNNAAITDETNRTLTIANLNSGTHNGVYGVSVNDGTCTDNRAIYLYVVDPGPTVTNQPVHAIVQVGDTATFTVGADGHTAAGYPLNYQWRFNGNFMPGETSSSVSIVNAQIANAGIYDVNVFNGYGSIYSAAVTLDVVPVGTAIGNGTGLRGNYFSSHAFTNGFTGSPTVSRVDPTIDFDFGTGSPASGISVDNFMVRWSGQLQALGDDTYTIHTISDDGVRLWINNQNLIDNWTAHSPTTNAANVILQGTNKYDVLMEYFESGGSATAKLYWTNASGGITWEAVPASQLYPAAAGTAPQETIATSVSNGTNLVLTIGPGSCILQSAAVVTGPYVNIATNVVSPYTVINGIGSGPQKFYRLLVQ